jgi:hypothetical protein
MDYRRHEFNPMLLLHILRVEIYNWVHALLHLVHNLYHRWWQIRRLKSEATTSLLVMEDDYCIYLKDF